MISNSVKRKRRRNRAFYEKLKTIRVYLADDRYNFWLVSLIHSPNYATHKECIGLQQVVQAYRAFMEFLKHGHEAHHISETLNRASGFRRVRS